MLFHKCYSISVCIENDYIIYLASPWLFGIHFNLRVRPGLSREVPLLPSSPRFWSTREDDRCEAKGVDLLS